MFCWGSHFDVGSMLTSAVLLEKYSSFCALHISCSHYYSKLKSVDVVAIGDMYTVFSPLFLLSCFPDIIRALQVSIVMLFLNLGILASKIGTSRSYSGIGSLPIK